MKIRDCMMVAAAAVAVSSPASAAIWTVNFTVGGTWDPDATGMPWGLSDTDVLTGSFEYTDADPFYIDKSGSYALMDVFNLQFSTGPRTWGDGDLVHGYEFVQTFDPAELPFFFQLYLPLTPIPDAGAYNYITGLQATLYDGVNTARCWDCTTFAVTEGGAPKPGGVPEPATWTMMIAGFGLAGAALRRRRALA